MYKFFFISLILIICKAAEASIVTDFLGQKYESNDYSRIVALMPSIGEHLIDLGFGNKLLATPEYTNLSIKNGTSSLAHIKSLGPYTSISAEYVYSLKPDIVFASMDGNDPNLVRTLRSLKVKVVVLSSKSLKEILESFKIVSEILHSTSSPLQNEFQKIVEFKEIKNSKRVFVQIGWSPLITVGPKTFINEIVNKAGGVNIFADVERVPYPRPNVEEVIKKDPDIILICKLTPKGDEVDQALAYWKKFKSIKAVKENKIYVINGDFLTKPNFSLIKGYQELLGILK